MMIFPRFSSILKGMELETFYPPCFMTSSNWFVQESNYNYNTEWTREENKQFESALAIYDKDTPDRWRKVAAMIPGKTEFDVIKQYKELEEDVTEIEAGRVPIPGYIASSFTFELVSNHSYYDGCRKRAATLKGSDQERKKGVPWTEEEHRRFLMGLMKYGKGDWRNISRNFVVTKTPTQVASHAQKYYIRQKDSGGKDKRRPSIHDITTVNLTETATSDKNNPLVLNESLMLAPQQKLSASMSKVQLDWINHYNDGSLMVFNPTCDDLLKLQGQDLYDCAFHEAYAKLQVPSFRTASRDFNKEADYGIHAL
ncbi:hypothetical protein RIF29_17496 [Crotalaria pallida]|uniref:Uncharacterized protein n=1 Tax=Crotalaria pallida TaxID=3830 RepID=A0AAN9FH87_CROPI